MLTSSDPVIVRHSVSSSDIAIVTAASFAILAAIVGGLADHPQGRSSATDWQLRGTLAPTDARRVAPGADRTIASRDQLPTTSRRALPAGAKAV